MTTPKQAAALQTREHLIAVARHVIVDQRQPALTLDAVAKAAGVSKGGLLHHFPSKDALVEAILGDLLTRFEAAAAARWQAEPPTPGRWLRAYIEATFADDPVPLETITLLAAAITEKETLMTRVVEDNARWYTRLTSDGIPPVQARIVRMAVDSYWVERVFGQPLDDDERAALRMHLLRLVALYAAEAAR